jgi:hypothetical protein
MSAMILRRAFVALVFLLGLAAGALAQTPAKLQSFPSAEAAADALTDAVRKNDDKAITAILGSGWRDFVPGNPEDEDRERTKFLAAWDESHKLVPADNDKMLVEVGKTGWVAPIPIVKDGTEWRYDVEAGRKEIQAREIGHNELAVMQTLLAVVDAEHDYAALDPMKTGVVQYARRLLSSPGKKDGLYWETKPGEPESPLGLALAKAQLGERTEEGYHGYRFRLLYSQGAAAPGGAYDYLVNGRMLGGFAVIAWPVRYGETGVSTFIVSHSGDVYERDLGPQTAQAAAAITVFNPDKEWQKSDVTPP